MRHSHAVLLQAGMSVVDVSHRLGYANPAITLELHAHAVRLPGHILAETFDRLLADQWRPGVLINSRRHDEPTPDPNEGGA